MFKTDRKPPKKQVFFSDNYARSLLIYPYIGKVSRGNDKVHICRATEWKRQSRTCGFCMLQSPAEEDMYTG